MAARNDPGAAGGKAAKAKMAALLRQRVALAATVDAEISKLIDQAVLRITAQLATAPTDYQRWVLPRLMEGIRRVADELAQSAGTRASVGLTQAWTLGEQLGSEPVQAAVTAEAAAAPAKVPSLPVPAVAIEPGPLGVPSLRQLRAMQAFTTQMIGGASQDMVTRINRQLGQVILGAQAPFDAIRAVQATLPEKTKSQVRGIVHTQLAHAFNTSSHASLLRTAARDPGIRKQWRRSGKLHSRWNHDLADGQVQDVDKPFKLAGGNRKGPVEIMFPCDPAAPVGEVINCGCVALPWKATWKMSVPAAKAFSAEELKARPDRGALPSMRATTTKERFFAAFGGEGSTYRDVTGQTLTIDKRLFVAQGGGDKFTKNGRDLYAYHAVQTIKRPSEIWETEAIDQRTGEIVTTRRFLKRFKLGGEDFMGVAAFSQAVPGGPWTGRTAFVANKAGDDLAAYMKKQRATGKRVWPPPRK